jgi:tetratricopeptide (TPR) repeat protein
MNPEAEKLLLKAEQLLNNGSVVDAVSLLTELNAKNTSSGNAAALLADVYLKHFRNFLKAEELAKKALTDSPMLSQPCFTLADIYLAQERYTELIAILNKASEIVEAPKDKVFERFGRLYEIQARFDDAAEYYKKAILQSFSENDIRSYESALQRCELKKKYL